ncbi:MAG: hypothetical protein HUU55_16055 [Myxococcales bacterium]|nr:hypothetical protein [Myxococcales bacterium]
MIATTKRCYKPAVFNLILLGTMCVCSIFGLLACSDDSVCSDCGKDGANFDGSDVAESNDTHTVFDVVDTSVSLDSVPLDVVTPVDVGVHDMSEPFDIPKPSDAVEQHETTMELDTAETDTAKVNLVDIPLVDPFLWVTVDTAEDPWFTDQITPGAICDEESYGGEITPFGPWLDVDTSFCSYITLTQPLLVPIPKGAQVTARVKHDGIDLGDGEYQVTLVVGPEMEVIAHWTQAVPSEPAVLLQLWPATRDFAAGEPMTYHIQNHGANRWSLTDCYVSVPER